MAVTDIKDGETVLARHISAEEWGSGLKFFSPDEDFIQVGMWGYDDDKKIEPHAHNVIERNVNVTQESLYIRKGSVTCHIYDLELNHVQDVVASEGDILILLTGGHGYSVNENGTQVLEVKNGPYVGTEDRKRFLNT